MKMSKSFTAVALVAIMIAATGCTTTGNATLTNKVSLDSIKVNETTKEDISRMFGAPSGQSKSLAGETWNYNYTSISMVPFFGSADIRQLNVTFDNKGRVTEYNTHKNGY